MPTTAPSAGLNAVTGDPSAQSLHTQIELCQILWYTGTAFPLSLRVAALHARHAVMPLTPL